MSYSIYENLLPIGDCKYYCREVAKKLGLKVSFEYFEDNLTKTTFPGNSDLTKFKAFQNIQWRIKFNLVKSKELNDIGLDAYVLKYKKLDFHLAIKGYSFLYTCKFSSNNHNETVANAIEELYKQEANGQLAFNF